MTEKLLNGSNVITGFEQVGCKGMAEGMDADSRWQADFLNRLLNCLLKRIFVNMVATHLV